MLDLILRFFASLKLTVFCLVLAMVLVFIGTMAQVEEGLYAAQDRYFRSIFIYWSPQGADWKIPVFPGGYLIGAVLLVNLLTAHAERFKPTRGKFGIFLAHAGLIILVLGQFATDVLSVESHMRLVEGQPKNYSESGMKAELAVIDATQPDSDRVIAFPEEYLARHEEIRNEDLPFTIRVKKYFRNSRLAQRSSDDPEPAPATQGAGQKIKVTPVPPTTRMDERNVPSAVLELVTPQGSLGTWLVSLMLDEPQPVVVSNQLYRIALRPMRYYKQQSITLLKFSHDKYPGTEIPKNFSSRIRLQRPDTGEDREVLIYMNNPLRYGGETFYQSSYDPNDPRVSILQVVRNPGWLTPYFACLLVGAGLTIQFMSHLLKFVKKRRNA